MLELHLESLADDLEDPQRLADDLGPGPVTRDHTDPVGLAIDAQAPRPGLGRDRRAHGVTSFSATNAARLIAAR